jgi:hypothetical protein
VAVVASGCADRIEETSDEASSDSTIARNTSQVDPPNMRTINQSQRFYWATKTLEQYDKLQALQQEGDKEALSKYLGALIKVGYALQVYDGEKVFIQEKSFSGGMVKIRQKGEIDEYWLPSTAFIEPTNAMPKDQLSAEIVGVKIVFEPNVDGKMTRVVKISWKNTGSKTIRSIDGNFYIADNTGVLPGKFNHPIFACSNLDDGVKPGAFVREEGVFVLPVGCTATEAKVEITEVLEHSNL